jgi:hypothetical protein
MNLHDAEGTLTVEFANDGSLTVSVNRKRGVRLVDVGARVYYGADVLLTAKQVKRLCTFLNDGVSK